MAGRVPLRKVVTGLVVLLVLVLGFRFLFGAAERLELVAEEAAQAIASGDQAALASLAAPGTAEDVRRWFDAVHPRWSELRSSMGHDGGGRRGPCWPGGIRFNRRGPSASPSTPSSSGARDVSLADPSEATAAPMAPFGELTDWTLTRWGGWKLDGRATYARIAPTTATP